MAEAIYDKLAVIGCGLIGSSIVRAARAHGVAAAISVFDASPEVRARVRELGIADEVAEDAAGAARDADLVILAAPPGALADAAKAGAPALKPGATLTDVGSVKAAIAEALARARRRASSSCPATRSREPSSRDPTPASPNCFTAAGRS